MANLLLARLALIPVASIEIGYTYFYVNRLYFVLPKYSIGWLAAWALFMLIVGGSTFAQIFIYRSITGIVRLDRDTVLVLTIAGTHITSIGIGFYGLWKARSG
jgi:hypothetical protein